MMKISSIEGMDTAIAECRQWTLSTRAELGIVLSPSGSRIARMEGKEDAIRFGQRDANLLPGNWFVHSHGNNSALSPKDIQCAVSNGMKGVVAAGLDGSLYSATSFVENVASWVVHKAAYATAIVVAKTLLSEGWSPDDSDMVWGHWYNRTMASCACYEYEFVLGEEVAKAWARFLELDQRFGEPMRSALRLRELVLEGDVKEMQRQAILRAAGKA